MPDYDFRSLSPIDFEVFCRDLLNADLDLRLVSFAVGPDGGIDLRDPRKGAVTIAQCKHRPDAKKDALVTTATKEAERWNPRDMNSYLFVVSSTISPDAEKEILAALGSLPVTPESVWHRGTLNAALARNTAVEKDHLKLWLSNAQALEQITTASQWQRSEQLLQRITERIKLYVHTPAYAKAMKVLEEKHLVMISGAPGVGKSTLAEMILLSLWHDGWTVVNIASDIDEAWRQIRTEEEKVVFYYDDFLGQTSSAELQKNEGSGVAHLMDRIRRGNGNRLLVLTTREQVLSNASQGDDDRVRRLSEDQSKLRIDLSEISRYTKAQMFFNHLYFGFNDPESRATLASDPRYKKVIDHQGFNPRILESVTLSQQHADIDSFYAAMLEALDHPESIWAGSFRQLSLTAVRILFQLAISPAGFMYLDELRTIVKPEDPREWVPALKVLENTWISLSITSGAVSRASLFDPSRRDFLLDLLDDPVYFDSVLDSASSLSQISYLYRLAGLVKNPDSEIGDNRRPALRACAEARLPTLDALVVNMARSQLEIAKKSEEAVRERNVQAREEGRNSYEMNRITERVNLMINLSAICFSLDVRMPDSESMLRSEIGILVNMFGTKVDPDASELFQLGANLAFKENRQWAVEYAVTVTEAAFANIADSEAVNEYVLLPKWFRKGIFKDIGDKLLEEYVDNELDVISQHNDREEASQWLDDLEALAFDHHVHIYSDRTREHIDQMDLKPEGDRSFSYPSRLSGSAPPASDRELGQLFAKLKA